MSTQAEEGCALILDSPRPLRGMQRVPGCPVLHPRSSLVAWCRLWLPFGRSGLRTTRKLGGARIETGERPGMWG